jgi:multiple sugar transport system ATP-binding protein
MQRVSIGRAIVRSPQIFLMDEPLSNLDAKLRESLRVELKHLQKTQNSTTLFVTHDQVEALTMADRIAVMREGRVVQIGTPVDIYDRPATTFVAQLVGTPRINLVNANYSDGALHLTDSVHVRTPKSLPASLLVGIRPEDVQIQPDGEFAAEVALVEPLGVETVLHLKAGTLTLVSLMAGMTHHQLGSVVRFNINRDHLHYFGSDKSRL